jgi:citrate synthase
VHEAWGKPLTLNISMPMAAVLLDLGLGSSIVKAVPILARTASLLGHLAEEQQNSIGFQMAKAAEDLVEYVPDAGA